MRKFFIWLFRAALFIVGFMAFVVIVSESTEVVEPWYFFPMKFVAMGVMWGVYKIWWWSLSPAEKSEYEREEV